MNIIGRMRRATTTLTLLGIGLALGPNAAYASTLQTTAARQHFGWLQQVAQIANGVVPLLSMLAIVGGLIMWGIGGGSEGVMKKLGPVVAAFGVAGFILSSGSFLGIGAAVM